jgi:hypothetical protein
MTSRRSMVRWRNSGCETTATRSRPDGWRSYERTGAEQPADEGRGPPKNEMASGVFRFVRPAGPWLGRVGMHRSARTSAAITRPATPMSSLILKRASTSRPSGQWGDDDYDVLCDGEAGGRIMRVGAGAPLAQPSFWGLAFGHHEGRTPTDQGAAAGFCVIRCGKPRAQARSRACLLTLRERGPLCVRRALRSLQRPAHKPLVVTV